MTLNYLKMQKTKEEILYDLLAENGAMDIDQMYYHLSDLEGFTERVIKETVLKLRQQGKIAPNHEWKMQIRCK